MAETRNSAVHRELFRYASVARAPVFDLSARLSKIAGLRSKIGNKTGKTVADRRRWAREYLRSSDSAKDVTDLDLPIFEHLTIDTVPERRLPCRDCVADAKGLAKSLAQDAKAIKAAQERTATSLYAELIVGETDRAQVLLRTLQFLERLPELAQATEERAYAPVVLARHRESREAGAAQADPDFRTAPQEGKNDADVLAVWDIANSYVDWRRRTLDSDAKSLRETAFKFNPPNLPARLKKETKERRLKQARVEQYRAYARAKSSGLSAITEERAALKRGSTTQVLAAIERDAAFIKMMEARHGMDVAAIVDALPPPGKPVSGFCEIFAKSREDTAQNGRPDAEDCMMTLDNPCVTAFAGQRHRISGRDDVRPLGIARLVTVEEQWMGYSPGEISAVETVLKGELRRKEAKTTRYFEEFREDTKQETSETEAETTTTTEQELSTQVEREVATRFSSDINAEASGSGGGTIGVVNFEGGASLGANVGLGVDTSFSTSSDTSFSQEIVSRAVERTKRITSELRRQRSYRLFETTNTHEIDNTGSGTTNMNAVYCYLDKEVCITERVYGLRQFLGAEILNPGQELLKQEMRRHVVDASEAGRLPEFNLTPQSITPENYLSLVGKFRAANISPPPPAIRMESRTYKTDAANESREPSKPMIKEVADTLAPFFGQYKRFLIQDNIEIPEGYRVQEVAVTVTHGQNGVSIPAHLPFSLLGASIFALPTLGAAAIPPYTFFYLPMAIWQVLYTASPLMHYNADSSNVTINVGHDTAEAPYFFFEPDLLMREVLDALGSSSVLDGDVLGLIQGHMETLYGALGNVADPDSLVSLLSGLSDDAIAEMNTFIADLRTWLSDLVTNIIPNLISGGSSTGPTLPPFPSISPALIAQIPAAIIAPFKTFFDTIMEQLQEVMRDVLGDLFEVFAAVGESTDHRVFGGTRGFTGNLPVSFNCVSLKPGITINLTACMVRIEDQSLDLWRLETFDRLSQAYAQMEAEYAAKLAGQIEGTVMRGVPTVMREEEIGRASCRERV